MYILVPYLLFSVLFFTVAWYHRGGEPNLAAMSQSFWPKLATGKSYTHLYFIFINIQFYLLFPLVLMSLKRFRGFAAVCVLVGIGLQWLFYIGNDAWWDVTNRNSWSLSFLSYYFLGAWIGIYYDRVKDWLTSTQTSRKTGSASWAGSPFGQYGWAPRWRISAFDTISGRWGRNIIRALRCLLECAYVDNRTGHASGCSSFRK